MKYYSIESDDLCQVEVKKSTLIPGDYVVIWPDGYKSLDMQEHVLNRYFFRNKKIAKIKHNEFIQSTISFYEDQIAELKAKLK